VVSFRFVSILPEAGNGALHRFPLPSSCAIAPMSMTMRNRGEDLRGQKCISYPVWSLLDCSPEWSITIALSQRFWACDFYVRSVEDLHTPAELLNLEIRLPMFSLAVCYSARFLDRCIESLSTAGALLRTWAILSTVSSTQAY